MSRRRAALLAVLAVLALISLVPAYAVSVAKAWRQADERAAWSRTDRELAGAAMAQVDTRILLAARKHVPRDATYAIVTGDRGGATELGVTAAPSFAAYALLPRRRVADPAAGDWVLAYGAELPGPQSRYARIVRVADGFVLGEVRR